MLFRKQPQGRHYYVMPKTFF